MIERTVKGLITRRGGGDSTIVNNKSGCTGGILIANPALRITPCAEGYPSVRSLLS